jgi:transposase
MFVREKRNKSGVISVQVIDKSGGRYHVVKTIGSSADPSMVAEFVSTGKRYIKTITGTSEFDFIDYKGLYGQFLSSIVSHRQVGVRLVLGRIFDQIGFGLIQDDLFRDLVLYRLVYPRSKLKTTEYLYRYEQKVCTEDDVYRYMDKLYHQQREQVKQISFDHTSSLFPNGIQAVFYDVTTLYFEIDGEDELRKTGFSKEGKHQHPQIVLGLLVSVGGYPLAYEIFEGNKFEGHTMIPVLDTFKDQYKLQNLTVVADSGLLSNENITQLSRKGYEFILGARIKTESREIKERIMGLDLHNGQSAEIKKGDLRLIVTYSDKRAKKDRYNREKGVKRLQKLISSGHLNKSTINNRGYNKFLKMEGGIAVEMDEQKIQQDQKWDGLKGYLTNSSLGIAEILENYQQLWMIEKAFRVTKTDLKIRPIYHYKKHRIEAHVCLNFAAYKVYKELERQIMAQNSALSAEKVIEIVQSIYQITMVSPQNEVIEHLLITSDEQRMVRELFKF